MSAALAPVAQLDRASDYESEGRTFESFRARHFGSKARTPSTAASTPEAAVSVRSNSLRRPRIRTSVLLTTSTRWATRSEEHTSELQSLMRISYAVFCLKTKNNNPPKTI